jgi:hypothetical protein
MLGIKIWPGLARNFDKVPFAIKKRAQARNSDPDRAHIEGTTSIKTFLLPASVICREDGGGACLFIFFFVAIVRHFFKVGVR